MAMAAQDESPYRKPVPVIDSDAREFWERVRAHELAFQRCSNCGHVRYPPREHCPACLSELYAWDPSPTVGTVYSYVTFERAYGAAYEGEIPYNVSLVELPNGIRMWSNVIDIEPEEIEIGMAVELTYDDRTDDLTLPVFRPSRARSG